MNIDNFNAYAKLLIRGETVKPFNMRTIRSPVGNPEAQETLKELSYEKYGRNREEVEKEIYRRLRE
jgi:hypothetical protein